MVYSVHVHTGVVLVPYDEPTENLSSDRTQPRLLIVRAQMDACPRCESKPVVRCVLLCVDASAHGSTLANWMLHETRCAAGERRHQRPRLMVRGELVTVKKTRIG